MKTANEVNIILEAYHSLRDGGPYPSDHVVRDINGKFAFIVYDSISTSVFIAQDADGSVPLFWGTDADDDLVLSDDESVVKKACGKSSAPFPKGCFFTPSGGLRSFEYPLKELKPISWFDSSGQVCGAIFQIDEESKIESGIPRTGCAGNWSDD